MIVHLLFKDDYQLQNLYSFERVVKIVMKEYTAEQSHILMPYFEFMPVSIAERSKASTVFGRSNVEIAGSNPARCMDVCLCSVVLCR
jgi:hypothetical protein